MAHSVEEYIYITIFEVVVYYYLFTIDRVCI